MHMISIPIRRISL